MKTIKGLIVVFCIFVMTSANSQNQTQQQKEIKKNEVILFSLEEYSNLHMWYYNQVKEMKLSEEVDNDYSALFTLY